MNPFYRIAFTQAKKILTNPKETLATLNKVMQKTDKLNGKKSFVDEFKDNTFLFFGMTKDFVTGDYRKLSFKTVAKVFAGLIYFLFVIDLVPDFLAVIGFADDAAVLAWVVTSISGDIEKYKNWKNNKFNNSIMTEERKNITT